jgi:hypothetical protein
MTRLVMAAALSATLANGCVTTAALAKPNRVSLPLLIGAAVGDLVVITLVASQLRDFTNEGALATGAAVTAVDIGVACILGGCKALRP